MQLQYTIFQYAQITSHATPITLGILFHEPSLDHREFRFTHDLSRLSQLTPELDLGIVQKLLTGIKEEVEQRCAEEKAFDIEEYTRFYLNDFCFEEIQIVCCDDIENMIAHLCELHLE